MEQTAAREPSLAGGFGRTLALPLRLAVEVGETVALLGDALRWAARPPYRMGLVAEQMEFVGVGSFWIILLVGTFSGMVMALQGVEAARLINAENFVGATVALTLARELAPVLTALMVTARAVSAMATEIGSMRITEQIDALRALAVSPVQYLVVPRVAAGVVMLPLLTVVFDLVGMAGCYVVAVHYKGVDVGPFLHHIQWYTDPSDVAQGLVKAAVFGLLVTLIGCRQGYSAAGGAKGVGMATTRAVVAASVTVLIADYFLTDILLAVL